MIRAEIDEIKTAPADISLIFPNNGSFSRLIKSISFSMQLLNISAIHTKPMEMITSMASDEEILK